MPTTTDWRSPFAPLARPRFPYPAEQARSERQSVRWAMLQHDFADHAKEFFEQAFGLKNARRMGLPDTTLAPLPYQTAQLTTPGLYQTPPMVTSSTAGPAVDRMLDPHTGVLARAGYWTRMPDVMYHAVGIGVYGLRLNVASRPDGPTPTLRTVRPQDCIVWCHPDDPLYPLRLAELRLRHRRVGPHTRLEWFWDVFDLTNDGPHYGIYSLDAKDEQNYAPYLLDDYDPDDTYPWLDPDGRPYLPYVWYRATDTGEFWPEYRRGLLSGTLRAVAYWTLAGHAALWAQGNHNFMGGVEPGALPADIIQGNQNRDEAARPTATFDLVPGTVSVLPVEDGKQLQLLAATTGIDLDRVASFANLYHMQLATMDGLSPSDATRRSANPTSGAALAISQADKKAFAAKVTPFFRSADTEAIRKLAWMMARATGEPHEADGYSITYDEIPLTPTEQADQRDQLEWEQQHGQRSPVDVHLALHPGKTREQAREAIVAAKVDAARIEADVGRVLVAAGLAEDPAEDVQRTALNGAQVQALQGLVAAVASGQIPRDSAVATIQAAFPGLHPDEPERIVGSAGAGFVPARVDDAAPPTVVGDAQEE